MINTPVKKLCIFFIVVIFFFSNLAAQNKKDEYKKRIAIIENNISKYFYNDTAKNYKEFNERETAKENEFSYLWPLCGLIQAANEAEAIKLAPSKYLKNVLKTIYHYNDETAPALGYASYIKKSSRFYDDNQWIGIACMDAYERTLDKEYLFEGRKIYTFMMTGYDTLAGGGLYWKEDEKTTKNTCSNGPGIVLALQLYKATKNKYYLDTALLLYNWVNKNLESENHIFYDNIHIPSLKIDKAAYTYNTATMLQSNVLLYEITKDEKYLAMAKEIAAAAYDQFYKGNRWPSHYWFNVVLLRAFISLYKYDAGKKYIDAFITDADLIWANEKDGNNMIGKNKKKQLIDQAAMLETYCRLLKFVN